MYARMLYEDDSAALDDLRKSVETFEDLERTTRRIYGSSHPLAKAIERDLRNARAALWTRST